jgi:hypothetical protein
MLAIWPPTRPIPNSATPEVPRLEPLLRISGLHGSPELGYFSRT